MSRERVDPLLTMLGIFPLMLFALDALFSCLLEGNGTGLFQLLKTATVIAFFYWVKAPEHLLAAFDGPFSCLCEGKDCN